MRVAFGAFLLCSYALTAQDQPARWTMTGRVLTAEDGKPLAGCTVTADGFQATGYPLSWAWLDWCNPEPAVTGADGRFAITLPAQPGRSLGNGYPSRVHLTLKAAGRAQIFGNYYLSRFFDQPDQGLGAFRLPRGATPKVTVVDTAGVPQRQVRLRLSPVERPAPTGLWYWVERWQRPRTGDDGIVQWEQPLPPGTYELTTDNRELAADPGRIEVPDTPTEQAPSLQLVVKPVDASATAAGRVVDTDGKPVDGYLLYAEGATTADGKERRLVARSDDHGHFEFVAGGLQLGSTFRLRHPRNSRYDDWHEFGEQPWGKRDIVVNLVATGVAELQVTAPVQRLAVHLVPASADVPGADPVRLTGTYPGGNVRIEGLRGGTWFVRVHAQGTSLWPSEWTAYEVNATPQPMRIALRAPVTRTLHLFTEEGKPAAGASVQLLYGDGGTIAASHAKRGRFQDFGIVDRTMTGSGPGEPIKGVVADRAEADRSGKVKLRGLVTDQPVYLRICGGGTQDTMHELPGWSAGAGAILVTVSAGGELEGKLLPPEFASQHDISTEDDRGRYSRWSIGTNPWRQSLADLLAGNRPGIALRAAGEQQLSGDGIAPLADDGSFRFAGVAPGEYDVVLVMRRRVNDRVRDEIVEPPLARTNVAKGSTQQLSLTVPDQLK